MYITHVSAGVNKTGSYKTGRPSITGSSFSHSQQTYSVPSALLIGNESTERGPLIANES